MISALALLGTFTALSIPAALIFIPWTLVTGDATMLYNAALKIIRAGFCAARIRVQVEGCENIPAATACIFLSNHVSNLDPPALLLFIPGRSSAFLKSWLMRVPILGYGLKLGEFIPVDRGGSAENAKQSEARARAVLAKGIHIVSFVEGTRSRDGRLLQFKKGAFYLAAETGAPCVPVSIHGTEAMMRKGSLRIHPGTAHVRFHPPLSPANYGTREELMAAVRAAIASGLPEWMRPRD